MPQSRFKPGAQQVAPEGLLDDGALPLRSPLLPWLTLPELRVEPAKWQVPRRGLGDTLLHLATEPRGHVRRSVPRLPTLPPVAQRVARNPALLSSLLLPPLFPAGAPRGPAAPQRPTPAPRADQRQGQAREAPGALGALLRELLPCRVREFLCQLRPESEEQRPKPPKKDFSSDSPAVAGCLTISASFRLPAASESQQHAGAWEHRRRSAPCPDVAVLPDLRGQLSYQQLPLSTENLKILLHQISDLGSLRSNSSQFSAVRKSNHRPHSTNSSKLQAGLTHSSSGEGPGLRKRCCPFRVRFADETLRDTALRYWERSCSIRQSLLEGGTAPQPVVSEQVIRSVGRWLESLPRAMCPGTRPEKARGGSSPWEPDSPNPPTQEPPGRLPERTSGGSSGLPCISKETLPRQRGELKTHLDAPSILKQVGKLPRTWSQKLESFLPSLVLRSVLKRRPKGYQLLLPSEALPRIQR
ncbi:uncharacterized protein C9orf50 homolog [Tenrec ecaudatus]|uniref:uncharacterized protein C9orf50 homolog n=1 Tax=Tenrec ecaudatus TaxID=94439 RepID=UPI003F5950A3